MGAFRFSRGRRGGRDVIQAVAKHPKTRIAGLRTLANDPNIPIQVTVAQHPKAGKELLLALAGSEKDASVREVARERLEPLLRGEIREDVLERWNTDYVGRRLFFPFAFLRLVSCGLYKATKSAHLLG